MTDKKSILIAYPTEFLCYSKLKRKIDTYTSKLSDIELVFFEDPNSYIKKYADEKNLITTCFPDYNTAIENCTYAILFEDRDCFKSLREIIQKKSIKLKVIPLELTIVVNKERVDKYDVYIGRGTVWGNPYQIGQDGDRDEVIRKFAYDFERGFLKAHHDLDRNIANIKGKVIACHCKPAACHGDIIAAYVNSIDDKK